MYKKAVIVALAAVGTVVVVGRAGAVDGLHGNLIGDFTQPDALAATVAQVRPAVIVNAAAHTAVDKAESEPDLARTINALAPAALASPLRSR